MLRTFPWFSRVLQSKFETIVFLSYDRTSKQTKIYIDIDVEIYIICNCIGICEYNRAEPNAPPYSEEKLNYISVDLICTFP